MQVLALLVAVAVAGQAPAKPVPQPFPRPGEPARPSQPPAPPPPRTPAAPPAAAAPPPPARGAAPGADTLGVAVYPNAQFLSSYEAGRGQRFYIFGSTASFVELVTYYRTLLKQRGELVFETPATHEFEIGRFREDSMAFPPSVTIKDYQSAVSAGYPNPTSGALPARFPTLIQIVPVPPGAER